MAHMCWIFLGLQSVKTDSFGNDGGLLMIISCKLVTSGRCSFVIVYR